MYIELWVFFDACGVSTCGFWVGLRPPFESLEAERTYVASSVKGDDVHVATLRQQRRAGTKVKAAL